MCPTVTIGDPVATIAIGRTVAGSCRLLIHLSCHHLIEEHLHLLELLKWSHLLLLLFVLLLLLVLTHVESVLLSWTIVGNGRWRFTCSVKNGFW